jgi:hypothetical protein
VGIIIINKKDNKTYLVICVTNKERLCGERVRLNLNIGASELVHEAGLSDVGVSAHQEGSGVGVNVRKTGHMLSDLLEVFERGVLSSEDFHHSETSFHETQLLGQRGNNNQHTFQDQPS